jgi:ABC-2 type transport system ATP-binding protein
VSAPPPAALELFDLGRRFGALTAVAGLSLTIARGELFGLVGPDGAGKTTALRMLAGILTPSAGDALVAGHSVRSAPEAVKRRIAYMSQRFGLYGDLTVRENLDFYADLFEVPARELVARRERLLAFSELAGFQDRLADALSGGMKQKLGLACALIHRPEILLLDEPTNGVDPVSRRDFWRILYEMLKDGITIVMATAYLDEAERCHRVGLMDRGRLLALDTPERIRSLVPGQLVEVAVGDPVRARAAVHALPGVTGVTAFGRRLHVAVEDAGRDLPALASALAAAGVEAGEPRRILPSLEDAFIAVVQAARGAAERGAGDGRAA